MAKLSQKNQDILMIEVNRIVDTLSEEMVAEIAGDKYGRFYPPNNSFSELEQRELMTLKDNKTLLELLRKILADGSARAMFDLFNLIDWTSEPECNNWDGEGIVLVDREFSEDQGMMMNHDAFLDKYWDWVKVRKLRSNRLDDLKE